MLTRLLTRCGHHVAVAENVQEAMRLLGSRNFDVILSDIGLPDGTGHQIIAAAKRMQNVKGVALTGYGITEDMRRSEEAGFDFHLTKPVDFGELHSVLSTIERAADAMLLPGAPGRPERN